LIDLAQQSQTTTTCSISRKSKRLASQRCCRRARPAPLIWSETSVRRQGSLTRRALQTRQPSTPCAVNWRWRQPKPDMSRGLFADLLLHGAVPRCLRGLRQMLAPERRKRDWRADDQWALNCRREGRWLIVKNPLKC
jgi:hypothetical protein